MPNFTDAELDTIKTILDARYGEIDAKREQQIAELADADEYEKTSLTRRIDNNRTRLAHLANIIRKIDLDLA